MKKLFTKQAAVSFILGAMLFSSIPVLAESRAINGFYNNIRLKVNGTFIETDVEPFIVDGRTMVPARFVAEPLGASVSFNETDNCVEVVSNSTENSELINTRFYSTISYQYKTLSDLGEALYSISDGLEIAYDRIQSLGKNDVLGEIEENLNSIERKKNQVEDDLQYYMPLVDIGDTKDILSEYDRAITYYRDSIKYLKLYFDTDKYNYADSYAASKTSAYKCVFNVESIAEEGYYNFYLRTQGINN